MNIKDLLLMSYYGNRELIKRARVLSSNMTRAEIILWSRLRSKKIYGYHLIRLSDFEIETNIDATIRKIGTFIKSDLSPSQGDHWRS